MVEKDLSFIVIFSMDLETKLRNDIFCADGDLYTVRTRPLISSKASLSSYISYPFYLGN